MSSSVALQKKVLLSQQVSKKFRFHHVRNHPTSVLFKQRMNISYELGSKFQIIQIKLFQRSKASQSNILSIFYPPIREKKKTIFAPLGFGSTKWALYKNIARIANAVQVTIWL